MVLWWVACWVCDKKVLEAKEADEDTELFNDLSKHVFKQLKIRYAVLC